MAITVTNQTSCQSLRGQSVTVALNSSDTTNNLPNITVGALCTVSSSGKQGFISFVDSAGDSFKIEPRYPSSTMESSTTPGYLNATETITIDL